MRGSAAKLAGVVPWHPLHSVVEHAAALVVIVIEFAGVHFDALDLGVVCAAKVVRKVLAPDRMLAAVLNTQDCLDAALLCAVHRQDAGLACTDRVASE